MELEVRRREWNFAVPFRISYRTRTCVTCIEVLVADAGCTGRGEASGVGYAGETVDSMMQAVERMRPALCSGVGREELLAAMPPGGARSALDCALWDLESKRAGRRAWELAGIPAVRPLATALTISLDSPTAMARAAAQTAHRTLKLKLGGDGDVERVAAVRAVRPDARLIVDANQAWSERHLRVFVPRLAELGVCLIEQPLPAGADDLLGRFESAVPLCADESCQTRGSLAGLAGKYSFVNIKLDKAGGLTEALRLAQAARNMGLRLMVGCMAGSSLSVAPGFMLGQMCEIVDLDAPLLMSNDQPVPLRYRHDVLCPPDRDLWG